jgi:hypothetical protein
MRGAYRGGGRGSFYDPLNQGFRGIRRDSFTDIREINKEEI